MKTFGGRTSRGGGGGMSSTASDDHRSGLLPQQQQQRQAGGGHIGRQGPCSSTRHAQQQPLPSRPQQRQHGHGTTRRKLVLLVEFILLLVIMPSYQIIYEAVNYTSFGTGTSTSTNTSNNNKNMMKRKSITYRLYDKAKVQYKDKFNPLMRCSDDREGLSPSLGSKTVLGFTTSIQLRNLNVLLMGDSVMIQFGQAFQEMVDIGYHYQNNTATPTNPEIKFDLVNENRTGEVSITQQPNRHVLRYSWWAHEGITILTPPSTATRNLSTETLWTCTNSNSVVANWRITNMLRHSGRNKQLPNAPGGGWIMKDVNRLLEFEYEYDSYDGCGPAENNPRQQQQATPSNATSTSTARPNKVQRVNHFDIFIFRIPHGWMDFRSIRRDKIIETIHLANELFHATTIIIVNIPFSNNVQTLQDINDLESTNRMIRKQVVEFVNGSYNIGRKVKNVMLLELNRFSYELVKANAVGIGYDNITTISSTATSISGNSNIDNEVDRDALFIDNLRSASPLFPTYLVSERLSKPLELPASILQTCSKRVKVNSTNCIRNSISQDGMHWCMPAVAGRIGAAMSCLINCVYNENSGDNNNEFDSKNEADDHRQQRQEQQQKSLRSCERNCNDMYMNVNPVDESMIM